MRYSGVGILTFVADLLIVYLLLALGVYYVAATVIGFILAMIAAFFLNRAWTFHTHTRSWRIIFAMGVALVSLLIVSWCTYWGVEYLFVHYLPARIIAALVASVWSYVGDSIVTFQIEPFE